MIPRGILALLAVSGSAPALGQDKCAPEAPPLGCASALVDVASDARDAHQYDIAVRAAERALTVVARAPASEDAHVIEIQALRVLDAAASARGQYRTAEEWSRREIVLAASAFGERSVDHLLALNGLANALMAQERWREAEQILLGALVLDGQFAYDLKPVLNPVLRNNLALVTMNKGDRRAAEAVLMELATDFYRQLDSKYAMRRADLDDLPAFLARRGERSDSKDLRDALYQAAMLLGNLAQNCSDMGDSARCIEFFEESAHFHDVLAPAWEMQRALLYANLSATYRRAGRTADAERAGRTALAIYTSKFPDHPGVSEAAYQLGELQLRDLHDPAAALVTLREARDRLLAALALGGSSNEGAERVRSHSYVFRRVVEAAWDLSRKPAPAAPGG